MPLVTTFCPLMMAGAGETVLHSAAAALTSSIASSSSFFNRRMHNPKLN